MSRPDGSAAPAGPLRVQLGGLRVPFDHPRGDLGTVAARRLGLAAGAVRSWQVLRASLDARGRGKPQREYRVGLVLDADPAVLELPAVVPWPRDTCPAPAPVPAPATPPLVVGAGPAGLFAALRLREYGIPAQLLERGDPVEDRLRAVSRYWRHRELDPESNVQFGEGGAGTFSDGKLTYRGKDPRKAWVFRRLVAAGAPAEILFEARPHLGTDRLRGILRQLRQCLVAGGARLRFRSRVTGLVLQGDRCAGVTTGTGEVAAGGVFLASGHSARDLYAALARQGVVLEAKGLAVGVRAEVSQAALDRQQFGPWAGAAGLPPAEFAVKTATDAGRDVYSFCMCPGGTVIPAGSEPDGLVVNGMSGYGRRGRCGNAALVVPVSPADWGGAALGGLEYQRRWERRAAALGRGGVPAQQLAAFLDPRVTAELPRSNCPWPLRAAELRDCLPAAVAAALESGLPRLVRSLPALADATLLGVETRTSSPVRLSRGADLQSLSTPGLYPIGEGAGYAGGIVSAALDGVRAADAYVQGLREAAGGEG